MSSIFGGSKQSSKSTAKSSNLAYDNINSSFSPLFGHASEGAAGVSKFLGGDTSGFNNYKDATGFNFAAEQGSRGITGNAAARGLLRSGSTGKALVNYGNNLQQQYANNCIDKLLGLSNIGLGAGKLVTDAGQVSESTSNSKGKSKPGIGSFLGQIAGGVAASDRRLKKNVFKVGQLANGLNVYQYRYIDGSGPHTGVMADEVELIQPEALGPVIDGYKTVDYSKIEKEIV
jgi:hypothetical protein